MLIDAYTSHPHYADHVRPIWEALPAEVRGTWYVEERAKQHAHHAVEVIKPNELKRIMAADDVPVLVVSTGDYNRTAPRPTICGQHGTGQTFVCGPEATAGRASRSRALLQLCPGPHRHAVNLRYNPGSPSVQVGSPRVSDLRRRYMRGYRMPAKPTVAISFHWDCPAVQETRSAWWEYCGALGELAKAVHLIGHCHPVARYNAPRWYKALGVEYVTDFDEVCAQADMYCVDESSTLYEFAALGRPVVVLNSRGYRRNVEHGMRFWDCADVGLQVDHRSRLVETVLKAWEDSPAQKRARKAAVGRVFARLDGAAEAAATEILAALRYNPACQASACHYGAHRTKNEAYGVGLQVGAQGGTLRAAPTSSSC